MFRAMVKFRFIHERCCEANRVKRIVFTAVRRVYQRYVNSTIKKYRLTQIDDENWKVHKTVGQLPPCRMSSDVSMKRENALKRECSKH